MRWPSHRRSVTDTEDFLCADPSASPPANFYAGRDCAGDGLSAMTSPPIRDPLGLDGPPNPPPVADPVAVPHRDPGRRRVGPIVAGSLIAGLVAAAILVAMPFVDPAESTVTGVVLFGFALGWALL